jgi:hypothetical protein
MARRFVSDCGDEEDVLSRSVIPGASRLGMQGQSILISDRQAISCRTGVTDTETRSWQIFCSTGRCAFTFSQSLIDGR